MTRSTVQCVGRRRGLYVIGFKMKNLEIRTIEHKGITVSIKIDYDKGTASLVNPLENYRAKKWLFAERGLEYMNRWQDILEAMQVAVKECKDELEEDEKRKFQDGIEVVAIGETVWKAKRQPKGYIKAKDFKTE